VVNAGKLIDFGKKWFFLKNPRVNPKIKKC
jgi:hypothetical protein